MEVKIATEVIVRHEKQVDAARGIVRDVVTVEMPDRTDWPVEIIKAVQKSIGDPSGDWTFPSRRILMVREPASPAASEGEE